MGYMVYLRESKDRFLKIGIIEERRKKERGHNFKDLLKYARKRYSAFGSADNIVLVPRDMRNYPKNTEFS